MVRCIVLECLGQLLLGKAHVYLAFASRQSFAAELSHSELTSRSSIIHDLVKDVADAKFGV